MKKKRVAVIGASGFFGKPLFVELQKSFDVTGTFQNNHQQGLEPLDITDSSGINNFFSRFKPDIVVHLAAIVNVDECEKNPSKAFSVHVTGTKNIVNACQKNNARLLYFSTDFVFDGQKGNYSESDSPNPINEYGKTKLAGEKIVQKLSNSLIVRTSTPYSKDLESKKFIPFVIQNLSKGLPVNAFTDQIRSPSLVENVAESVRMLLEKEVTGIVHVVGASQVSMFDAALEVARVFGFDENLVNPVECQSANLAAVRPKNTGLYIQKALDLGLNLLSLHDGLVLVKKSVRFS
ncbi:SDR family oxidoreductase [Candidatus Micrarchaeota archaeon]|nr:SDR family oxidoreductase [Candidatus Micrarchaeota archaeon]MBU1930714.1 SDR family oxidoreductase [Candidatus Micrarchaeota archaeon]